MEILKSIDWDWILNKLIFLALFYVYYKLILKKLCSGLMNTFEKKYLEKIKNRHAYFFSLLFYNFFATLIFPILISGGAMIDETIENIINWDILIMIITFLYCYSKASSMMFKHKKAHNYL